MAHNSSRDAAGGGEGAGAAHVFMLLVGRREGRSGGRVAVMPCCETVS